mgnify:CR=1 FL=1
MVDELYDFYLDMKNISYESVIGSGNGIRKNNLLKEVINDKFKTNLIVNNIKEEAAYGAAIYSMNGEN